MPADSKQPTIRLEGQEVIGIWLRNTRIGSEINTGNFQVGHVFEIGLQSPDPKDPEWGALFHNFYISDQGDWLKSRSTEQANGPIENSEMTPYEFEIAGMAIKILQKRLDQALSATETPNR